MKNCMSKTSVDDSDEEETEEIVMNQYSKCTNSIGSFVPPYWTFVFSDSNLRDYCFVTVNIPSGICHKKYGLQNKVEALVAQCGTKITIACEWPDSMLDTECLQDFVSTGWSTSTNPGTDARTKYNILQAFDKELFGIRVKSKVSTNSMLGSTAEINLPFRVEKDMVKCQPNLDFTTGSVNLYIVVKRISTLVEQGTGNMMQVRVARAHGSKTKKRELEMYMQDSEGTTDSDSTLKETQAFLLQQFRNNK
jgi:hypothetical protein